MPEKDKDKKKVKVRPGYNPRTNAMRNRREGAPGSGTRQGKANRGGQGKQGQADIGKAFKNKVGELVRKGGDWLEKGNEDKPSPYIGLEKRYKTKDEWKKDQEKK
ncbi:MAG: hypothetical protein QGF31_08070 [Nitrospinota bacterium]|jgi:hypothetical protein|nr:hypothetical protein [Nitrospinota bacterium]